MGNSIFSTVTIDSISLIIAYNSEVIILESCNSNRNGDFDYIIHVIKFLIDK